jgi:hypothetical protein
LTLIYDFARKNIFKILITFTDISMFENGIDLVLQIDDMSIDNGNIFSTDSNGLFEIPRTKGDKWETSVYPINSFFIIKDKNSKKK